ncbi:hypothetical protein OQA88_677 [Cercophora sp. LCS_1]
MANVPDEVLERRRVQNRMAQRRFRQKRQGNRKAAEASQQTQDEVFPPFPETANLDVCFDDFVLSPTSMTSPSVNAQPSHTRESSLYDAAAFAEIESELARGSITSSVAVTNDALDPSLVGGRPGTSQLDSSSRAGREQSTTEQSLIAARRESTEPSPGSLSLLGQSSAQSTSSASSSTSGSGWLSALHMAAQRGHGGIVRFCKQPNLPCLQACHALPGPV